MAIWISFDTALCENCGLYIENPDCHEDQYFCKCEVVK